MTLVEDALALISAFSSPEQISSIAGAKCDLASALDVLGATVCN